MPPTRLLRSLPLLLTLALGATSAAGSLGCKGAPTSSKSDDDDDDRKKKKADDDDEEDDAKSKKKAEKTPDGVAFEWAKPSGSVSKLTITKLDAKGELSCFAGRGCNLRIDKLPDGTKVKIGDAEQTAKGKLATNVEVDVSAAVAKATPADALTYNKTVDPGLTLELAFPDGAKVSGPLPAVTTKYMIEGDLEKKLPNGTPVLFGKDEGPAPAQHTILFLGGLSDSDKVMGPAKTMTEVDLVAVHEALPKRSGGKKCTGYKATGEKGPGREADLMLVDWDVKLVERRTAKVLESKKFEAEKRCPMFAQGGETTSYPDRRAVQAWLRTKR